MTSLPLALYDGDCGFCQRSLRVLPWFGARVELRSLWEQDLAALGVDETRAVDEMPLVVPDGTVRWGADAWAGILATGHAPARLLGRVLSSRLGRPLARRIYAWVASHRSSLPGGTSSCAR